jgi:amino acid adenylation domain-containing protein
MTDIRFRVTSLPLTKRIALESLLSTRHGAELPMAIPRRSPSSSYRLSYGQERLWFLYRLDPASAAYNAKQAIRLHGALSVAVLRRSLEEVVTRHEILQTSFDEGSGEPFQIIAPPAGLPLPLIDMEAVPHAAREVISRRLLGDEACRTFNLSRSPLLRLLLIRMGPMEHILLLATHHIVDDGWSYGVFARELAALYEAFSRGERSPLAEPVLQYADYASWQREQFSAGAFADQLSYWRRQLDAPLPALDLPTDFPHPPTRAFLGARINFTIAGSAADRLRRLAQAENATLFIMLLTAYKTLLLHYSGQEDVIVGSPIANRQHPELADLIGFVANTVALRTKLEGNPTFREAIARVKKTALEAYANQDLPFEKLVECLHPERDLSRNPLFQVMFAFQSADRPTLRLPALALSFVELETRTTQFDLILTVIDGEDGMRCSLDYSTELFERATIRRMAEHFSNLLDGVVHHPDTPLSQLPPLGDVERAAVLQGAHEAKEYPQTQRLHEVFESMASLRRDVVAVVFESDSLTYGELNRRANQLAHYLRSLGVGPENSVGLCLERSLEMIVGILGTLKSGAAYVPLDSASPQERLTRILKDAQAGVLITQKQLLERFPIHIGKIVCLDADWERIGNSSSRDVASVGGPANLAYLIYTSGSTGQPNGVSVTHGNVLRLFAATAEQFHFSHADAWTMFHSFAFDFSVWEIWGALLFGGRLVVVPYWVSRSPEAFCELLCAERITFLNQTPSSFRQLQLLEAIASNPEDLAVRTVCFGGEALDFQILAPWFNRFGDRCRMVNMYGITETTVHVTLYQVLPALRDRRGASIIGRPISDLQTVVLDRELHPVPIGVRGEMYIGGAGLARGYLNEPALTAERFIPHPYSDQPGARLYRSGDLTRKRADGTLEYLGRNDRQVKIRGFRVELSEIEARLVEHPEVAQVAVIAQPGSAGDAQLGCYIVRVGGRTPSTDELRNFLKQRLPEYMMPAAFMQIDKMPLTANGKLDREALPPIEQDRYRDAEAEPQTPTEKELAAIWCELLGRERVGADKSFFEMGGHSLLATQLSSRVRDVFQVELKLRDYFTYPTIKEMAERIDDAILALSDSLQLETVFNDLQGMSDAEATARLKAAIGDAGEFQR